MRFYLKIRELFRCLPFLPLTQNLFSLPPCVLCVPCGSFLLYFSPYNSNTNWS